jgi:hypothetical protein
VTDHAKRTPGHGRSLLWQQRSAQPVIQLITLPRYFISGALVPTDQLPSAPRTRANPKGPTMASPFNVELSMSESPAEAQARAADAFTEPASAIGLRLTKRGAGELSYRPLIHWPFLVALWHNLNGEKMAIKFEPAADGGTHVTIDGAVARAKHPPAADPGHWTAALDGSAIWPVTARSAD